MEKLNLEKWQLRLSRGTFAERTARMMREIAMLSKVEIQIAKNSGGIALCKSEMGVLINTLLACWSEMNDIPNYGSILVYGQDLSSEAVCLLKANLRNGIGCVMDDEMMTQTTSDLEVEGMVKDILNHGSKSQPAFSRLELPEEDYLESRIYEDADRVDSVLVMNAEAGRYVVAFCGCQEALNAITLAIVAQVLACLRKNDAMLQESAALVELQLTAGKDELAVEMMSIVATVFASGSDPILKEWEDWQRLIDTPDEASD